MKKIIKKAVSLLIASAIAAPAAFASYSTEWTNIFSETFESLANGSDGGFTNKGRSFTDAGVENGAMEFKSDTVCYFEMNSKPYNSDKNAAGMKLLSTTTEPTYSETLITDVNGDEHNYYCATDKSVLMANIGDKNALRAFTYAQKAEAGTAVKTNAIKLQVLPGKFTAEDNKVTMEIEYYLASSDTQPWLRVAYAYNTETEAETSKGAYGYFNFDTKDLERDKWSTLKINIPNADFTQKFESETGGMKIFTGVRGEKGNYLSDLYIHSVKIYNTEDEENPELSYPSTVFEALKPLSDSPVYGNAEVCFDLTFPTGEKYNDVYDYNSGHNGAEINVLDQNKEKVASLLFDIGKDNAKIYAVSSASGKDKKEELFSGNSSDILGKKLSCKIVTDRENSLFDAYIENGADTYEKESLPLRNNADVDYLCNVQYLSLVHNPHSFALLTRLDNLSFRAQEDLDYKKCAEEFEKIAAEVTEGDVRADFSLPSSDENEDIEVIWSIESGDAIVIKNENGKYQAVVKRDVSQNKNVTLLLSVTYGSTTMEKTFSFSVISLDGISGEVQNAEERTNADGTVDAQMTLKYSGANFTEKTNVTFYAVSVDSQTGKILNTGSDTKEADPASPYGDLTFSIVNFDKKGGKAIYYLWDENNQSLINTPPAKVKNLKIEEKVTKIQLSWKGDGIDDMDSVDYYAVYRDKKLIAVTGEESYTDKDGADSKKHTYEVLAVDLNSNEGDRTEKDGKSIKMFTYSLGETKEDEETYSIKPNGYSGGVYSIGNSVYCEYKGKDEGMDSAYLYSPESKAAAFVVTKKGDVSADAFWADGGITSSDRKFKIMLTYYDDSTGKIQFGYVNDTNTKKYLTIAQMTNTRKLKTVEFELDDAVFSRAGNMSASDFTLSGSEGLYIKKIEIIQEEKY